MLKHINKKKVEVSKTAAFISIISLCYLICFNINFFWIFIFLSLSILLVVYFLIRKLYLFFIINNFCFGDRNIILDCERLDFLVSILQIYLIYVNEQKNYIDSPVFNTPNVPNTPNTILNILEIYQKLYINIYYYANINIEIIKGNYKVDVNLLINLINEFNSNVVKIIKFNSVILFVISKDNIEGKENIYNLSEIEFENLIKDVEDFYNFTLKILLKNKSLFEEIINTQLNKMSHDDLKDNVLYKQIISSIEECKKKNEDNYCKWMIQSNYHKEQWLEILLLTKTKYYKNKIKK